MSNTFFDFGLPAPLVASLDALFSQFGLVERTKMPRQRKSGRSESFGLVDVRGNRPDADIDALHGWPLGGRQLTLRPAR